MRIIFVVFFVVFSFGILAGVSESSYRRIRVRATAYCPCSICCGDFADGVTATGRSAFEPGVAVDPSIIRLGSRIDVPNYNRGVNGNGSWILVDDVGGDIKGYRIDVRFDTHEEAIWWGVRDIVIRVHQ